ncbi:MAG: hypothetical protein PHI35_02535 [Victivallaceae bacterium]|nr:hypothetical protein [Victivallaceae bacterium]
MRRQVFTLAELLLTILIIAVLLALLLPLLARARENAVAARCAGQTAELLKGMLTYTDDHYGVFPRLVAARPYSDYITGSIAGMSHGYVPRNILVCPGNPRLNGETGYNRFYVYGLFTRDYRTYRSVAEAAGDFYRVDPVVMTCNESYRFGRMRDPAGLMLVADCEISESGGENSGKPYFSFEVGKSAFNSAVSLVHLDRAVGGFGDGHVARRGTGDLRGGTPAITAVLRKGRIVTLDQ